jgi:hypothetical protein
MGMIDLMLLLWTQEQDFPPFDTCDFETEMFELMVEHGYDWAYQGKDDAISGVISLYDFEEFGDWR